MADQSVVMIGELLTSIRGRNTVSFEVDRYVEFVLQVEISRGFVFVIRFHFCLLRDDFLY